MRRQRPLFGQPLFTDEELRKGKEEVLEVRPGLTHGGKVLVLLPFVQLEEIRRLNNSTDKLLFVTVLLFLATLALLAVTVLLLRHAARNSEAAAGPAKAMFGPGARIMVQVTDTSASITVLATGP